MKLEWTRFPTIEVTPDLSLMRIHREDKHPAYFNPSSDWRFGPPPSRTDRFGVCYLGLDDPFAAYVERYGRFGVITPAQVRDDAFSILKLTATVAIADLTDRSVLGEFGITASHSTGSDYGPSRQLASDLFDAGISGIRYRVRHDPSMTLEAVALFGGPG